MDLGPALCPLKSTSSLWGRDPPRGTDGSILDAIYQNPLACSSWKALLVCELAGHGLGAKADPEEKEFRWPMSAALCPPGMSSWLHPQRQRNSLWLLQVLVGQESRMRHTRLSMGPTLCPVVASVITSWKTAWAFPPFPTGKAMPQCPQHPSPGGKLPVPSGQPHRSGCRPKALPPDPEGLS